MSLRSASLLLLAACAAPKVEPPPAWEAPANWAEVEPAEFETLALEGLPEGTHVRPTAATLAELRSALEPMDETSVRAAVLLARTGSAAAAEVLLTRLEQREEGPERESDAADFLAAAALAHLPPPEDAAERLLALSVGSHAHPDFEVRVECAARALEAGRDEVVPFLLVVLRVGTKAGLADEHDFPPSQTTAWARGRAALALSARAGLPVTYNADAPLADREREAERLARALQGE